MSGRRVSKLLKSFNPTTNKTVLDSDSIIKHLRKSITVGGGMASYDSDTDLPAVAVAFSKALVTSTNTLYQYGKTGGWYKIALINNFNPAFVTSPPGSQELSAGSTTITVLATDSDDVPITYTVVTDSGFNAMANITHDSDKHNVWTITTTASSGSHTGTVTFKAGDGVNTASASSTFTLSFTNPAASTRILLKADSDANDNQVDISSNSHTITENGTLTSTAFTPYHPGGYSVNFDGDDNLVFDMGTTIGSSDFTIEGWIRASVNEHRGIFQISGNTAGIETSDFGNTLGLLFRKDLDGTHYGWQWYGHGNIADSSGGNGGAADLTDIVIGKWYHFAYVKTSNTGKVYIDGVEVLSASDTTNYSSLRYVSIGATYNSTYFWKGDIRDFRVVIGTAVYTSSGFTPPTETLTAITNTKLLACHAPGIIDGSTTAATATINGNPRTDRIGPYDYGTYTISDHGGSMFMDGAGGYLSHNDIGIGGLNDFTVEGWVYPTAMNTYANDLYSHGNHTSVGADFLAFGFKQNGDVQAFKAGGTPAIQSSGGEIKQNTWSHLAFTRESNSARVFVNGKLVAGPTSITGALSTAPSGRAFVGTQSYTAGATTRSFEGFMADMRINNTALYSSNFTPPSSPLTAVSGTTYLTGTNKNKFYDASGSNSLLTAYNNITTSTSEVSYTGTSLYIAGRSDYISFDGTRSAINTLPGDFTIELECKLTSSNMAYAFLVSLYDGATAGNARIRFGDSGFGYHLQFVINNGGGASSVYSVDLVQSDFTSAFRHIAWTRASGVNRIFVDGTQYNVATGANPSTFSSASWTDATEIDFNHSQGIRIGVASYSPLGYLQNIRITNGLARYTSAFTAPTAEFNG